MNKDYTDLYIDRDRSNLNTRTFKRDMTGCVFCRPVSYQGSTQPLGTVDQIVQSVKKIWEAI